MLVPHSIPQAFRLSFLPVRLLSLMFLSAVVLYLIVILSQKTPLCVRGYEFPLPLRCLALGQIVISSVIRSLTAVIMPFCRQGRLRPFLFS